MSKARFRYERTENGQINIYFGEQYITTCDDFSEILKLHRALLSA
ncbi:MULTISPECIES: hypothetical protein [unclassified Lacrimispora]